MSSPLPTELVALYARATELQEQNSKLEATIIELNAKLGAAKSNLKERSKRSVCEDCFKYGYYGACNSEHCSSGD